MFQNHLGEFYAYRDSLKMYVSYPDDVKWHLLYDFTTNPGDTFYSHEAFGFADSIPVKVISKGDTVINGFSLPFMVTESAGEFSPFSGKAILNIGSESFFVPPHPIADPSASGLRCYEDTIIGLYQVLSPCDTLIHVGISNLSRLQGASILPNPASEMVDIVLDNSAEWFTTIVIRNTLGSIVTSKIFFSDHFRSFNLTVDFLAPGLYFVDIQSNKKRYTERLMRP